MTQEGNENIEDDDKAQRNEEGDREGCYKCQISRTRGEQCQLRPTSAARAPPA